NFLDAGQGSGGNTGLFAPGYKSPRSLQMNIGIQREIRHGMVFSADYLRNVQTHSLLSIDINKDGDISTFNASAAALAIANTNNIWGCGNSASSAAIDCAIAAGASMGDYALNGLGGATDTGGVACPFTTDENNLPMTYPCAFGGVNKGQAAFFQLKPVGRSVYNALQMKL